LAASTDSIQSVHKSQLLEDVVHSLFDCAIEISTYQHVWCNCQQLWDFLRHYLRFLDTHSHVSRVEMQSHGPKRNPVANIQ
jgi:hypothetical protein